MSKVKNYNQQLGMSFNLSVEKYRVAKIMAILVMKGRVFSCEEGGSRISVATQQGGTNTERQYEIRAGIKYKDS